MALGAALSETLSTFAATRHLIAFRFVALSCVGARFCFFFVFGARASGRRVCATALCVATRDSLRRNAGSQLAPSALERDGVRAQVARTTSSRRRAQRFDSATRAQKTKTAPQNAKHTHQTTHRKTNGSHQANSSQEYRRQSAAQARRLEGGAQGHALGRRHQGAFVRSSLLRRIVRPVARAEFDAPAVDRNRIVSARARLRCARFVATRSRRSC